MEQNLWLYKASINKGNFLFYSLDRVRLSLLEIKHLNGSVVLSPVDGWMKVKHRWNSSDRRKPHNSGKKIRSNTALSPTNSVWIDLKMGPAEKFLSYCTARFKQILLYSTPCMFWQSIYHPTNAITDTPFMKYFNSYMFQHRGAILRELLQPRYIRQHANIFDICLTVHRWYK
jgi:hypothetical protein